MKKTPNPKGNAAVRAVKGTAAGVGCLAMAAILVAANTVLPTYGRMVTEVLG